ncbi:UNVERIFIED_CONTAM: hypothetical protein Slati_4475400 [Sesamum latifolium]|uniref:Uncharacterized protein n=1 Tax=Sesamum latifolium TaxID=2727402 RepID=A0AAW2SSH9_9LAMI
MPEAAYQENGGDDGPHDEALEDPPMAEMDEPSSDGKATIDDPDDEKEHGKEANSL